MRTIVLTPSVTVLRSYKKIFRMLSHIGWLAVPGPGAGSTVWRPEIPRAHLRNAELGQTMWPWWNLRGSQWGHRQQSWRPSTAYATQGLIILQLKRGKIWMLWKTCSVMRTLNGVCPSIQRNKVFYILSSASSLRSQTKFDGFSTRNRVFHWRR